MNTSAIIDDILKGYALHPRGFHGVTHWARVMENGLKLCEETGANPKIVTLFAIYHDSRRENDGSDWGHGLRGAQLAQLHNGRLFNLQDTEFELLYRACEWHTDGVTDPDISVRTCWDADRLDLGRVGIRPDPKYLCTVAARNSKMIDWAHSRAQSEFEPRIVGDEWNIPLE